jgi:hypothetical protein
MDRTTAGLAPRGCPGQGRSQSEAAPVSHSGPPHAARETRIPDRPHQAPGPQDSDLARRGPGKEAIFDPPSMEPCRKSRAAPGPGSPPGGVPASRT